MTGSVRLSRSSAKFYLSHHANRVTVFVVRHRERGPDGTARAAW